MILFSLFLQTPGLDVPVILENVRRFQPNRAQSNFSVIEPPMSARADCGNQGLLDSKRALDPCGERPYPVGHEQLDDVDTARIHFSGRTAIWTLSAGVSRGGSAVLHDN